MWRIWINLEAWISQTTSFTFKEIFEGAMPPSHPIWLAAYKRLLLLLFGLLHPEVSLPPVRVLKQHLGHNYLEAKCPHPLISAPWTRRSWADRLRPCRAWTWGRPPPPGWASWWACPGPCCWCNPSCSGPAPRRPAPRGSLCPSVEMQILFQLQPVKIFFIFLLPPLYLHDCLLPDFFATISGH